MGTDIHSYVEVLVDGAWRLAPRSGLVIPDDLAFHSVVLTRRGDRDWCSGFQWWKERDYLFFAKLNGVRGVLVASRARRVSLR